MGDPVRKTGKKLGFEIGDSFFFAGKTVRRRSALLNVFPASRLLYTVLQNNKKKLQFLFLQLPYIISPNID